MERLVLMLGCLGLLCSCQQQRHKSEEVGAASASQVEMFMIQRFARKLPDTQKKLFTYSSEQISEDTYRLTYSDSSLTIAYKLSTKATEQPERWVNGLKDPKVFSFVDMVPVQLRGETIPIYKFARNYHAYDGCNNLFWSPNYGIIMERNPTWRNYGVYVPKGTTEKKQDYLLLALDIMNIESFGSICME